MSTDQLHQLLLELTSLPKETEWLEFKHNKAHHGEIGEYISALSNGACLNNQPFGYLVWGIHDKTHQWVGTSFKFVEAKEGNQDLELWLRNLLSPKINFSIHEADIEGRHFTLLQIPAAQAEPVYFKSKAYIRINSNKTELTRFPDFVRQIYNSQKDWSAEIIPQAGLSDLDEDALALARKKYAERNSRMANEITHWPDEVFLDKAKLNIRGQITRTTLLLLGKEESSHYLLPSVGQITWKLDTEEKAYEHFGLPFVLTTSGVADRIRNYKYKFFPDDVLLSVTVDKYDREVILEAMYNCIAHQDYSENSRVVVTEKKDRLIFTNAGSFFEGSPEDYSLGEKTPNKYRNPWLTHAMVNLGMIDTMGYGIHKMCREQRKRFFPLPQYDLSDPRAVSLTIYGHSIDEKYSKLLLTNTSLPLSTIILLDRFQKGLRIPDKELQYLKKEGLIAGRKPNYYLAEKMAVKTGDMGAYIKNRGFDKAWYQNLILEFIRKKGEASKAELKDLLWDKLSDVLSETQKVNKINNLIQELRREEKIENKGTFADPRWKICR